MPPAPPSALARVFRVALRHASADSKPGRSSRSVGMDELVRETGLGKMTVYRLFKSKDDLVGAYLSRKAATVLAFIDAELVRLEGDPRAALLSVVDAVEGASR